MILSYPAIADLNRDRYPVHTLRCLFEDKEPKMSTQAPYIVTGGNAGIGKAIAKSLAEKQKHVVIVSRDPKKGRIACEELREQTGHQQIDFVQGRLDSIEEVHTLAQTLSTQYPTIQCLINNAGVWMTSHKQTEDGLEWTYMVNHLAPFLLTRWLIPQLQQATDARIVNVNAGLYVFGTYDPERTPYGKDFHRMRTYADSKLCNILFTIECAKRLEGSGITINAVHPGVIRTGLGITNDLVSKFVSFLKLFWKSPQKGADAPVWLATSDEIKDISGAYFDLRKQTPFNEAASQQEARLRCWEQSEAFLPTTFTLPPLPA
ncbi:MAG TPA: retinol dehydrogenase [Myxococcales bacterium]|nr:retinol dehydrogenase [Deltaproteobacteria bacterium]MBU52383.1 retinol dehydrogenase [Deltaproteobacteria bacterium]HAA59090.1 retinol dehydrogenase [Myxococcales bacterium]